MQKQKTLSKREEMEMLDAFISELPADSYLNPALSGMRDRIEDLMQQDFIPDLSRHLNESVEEARKLESLKVEQAAIRAEIDDLHRRRRDAAQKLKAMSMEMHSLGQEVMRSCNNAMDSMQEVSKRHLANY